MKKIDDYSYQCGVIGCFNEMIHAGLKKIALSHPADSAIMRDGWLPFSREICQKYKTQFYIEDGQFAPGSMLPKVEAAVAFAKSGHGRKALITLLEKAEEGIEGRTGTEISMV